MFQADICFVVDSSGSINDRHPGNWDLVKNFMKDIVDQLSIGETQIRVGAVKFSNFGYNEFHLNDFFNAQDMKDRIEQISYAGGNTNTSGGLLVMRNECFQQANGDRPNVANTAIVITDGQATVDVNQTIPNADRAKNEGVRIIAVGVTDKINMAELQAIASPSSGNIETVFTVGDFAQLAGVLTNLLSYICVTPTTTTTVSTTPALRPVQGEHYNDVIMSAMASHITSLTIVYSTV